MSPKTSALGQKEDKYKLIWWLISLYKKSVVAFLWFLKSNKSCLCFAVSYMILNKDEINRKWVRLKQLLIEKLQLKRKTPSCFRKLFCVTAGSTPN